MWVQTSGREGGDRFSLRELHLALELWEDFKSAFSVPFEDTTNHHHENTLVHLVNTLSWALCWPLCGPCEGSEI